MREEEKGGRHRGRAGGRHEGQRWETEKVYSVEGERQEEDFKILRKAVREGERDPREKCKAGELL